jgi:hypothetical protein
MVNGVVSDSRTRDVNRSREAESSGVLAQNTSAAALQQPRLVTDVSQIANKIRFARHDPKIPGKTVFLIGAGCSISANIPSAIGIAKIMVGRLLSALIVVV